MSHDIWTAVDNYFCDLYDNNPDTMQAVLDGSRDAGLPAISISANQGRFLQQLVAMRGATRVLEVGTLGGYSAIWMAGGLKNGGSIISIELETAHAEVARKHIARCRMNELIEVINEDAHSALAILPKGFDFVFLDADKPSYPDYLKLILPLCAPNAIIVADNMVRGGSVVNKDGDEALRGIRNYASALADIPGARSTGLQTVGDKGYDGFTITVLP